jgi:hypothetical protein
MAGWKPTQPLYWERGTYVFTAAASVVAVIPLQSSAAAAAGPEVQKIAGGTSIVAVGDAEADKGKGKGKRGGGGGGDKSKGKGTVSGSGSAKGKSAAKDSDKAKSAAPATPAAAPATSAASAAAEAKAAPAAPQFDVILKGTIFHPQGGGQPFDVGVIRPLSVARVNETDPTPAAPADSPDDFLVAAVIKDADGVIRHRGQFRSAAACEPAVWKNGLSVHLAIDPELRKNHARLHTAGHLIDIGTGPPPPPPRLPALLCSAADPPRCPCVQLWLHWA